jgi:hypothetical protein
MLLDICRADAAFTLVSLPTTMQNPISPQAFVNVGDLIRRSVSPLSNATNRRRVTDETTDLVRNECLGSDFHTFHADFERWINADEARTPGANSLGLAKHFAI